MKTLILLAGLLVAGIALPQVSVAQITRADTAQVIYTLAEELMREGRTSEAEYLFSLITERFADTEFAVLAARALDGVVTDRESRSGRTELVAWSTVYGAALGILIPAALGAQDAEPYGLGLLIGGPAGFGLSKSWSGRYPVSSGQARAMTFGSWWGTWQGLGWQQALNLGDDVRTQCFETGSGIVCEEFRSESDQAPFTAMVLGGLSGMTVGTVIGRSRPISASSALVTNFAAMWGTWFGTVVGVLAHSDNVNSFNGGGDHTVLISSLVGGDIGLLAGAFGAPALNWTTGQAWTVHLAGLAGMVAGFGLDLLGSVEDTKAAIGIPGMTSAVALVLAAATVAKDDPTPPSLGPLQMSLLNVRNGDVNLGIPTPVPTVVPRWDGQRRTLTPGMRVTLLHWSM